MQEHLKLEDFERYMDTDDLSEEYLNWYEEVSQHLDGCSVCQKILDRLMAVDVICEEESLASGFSLLQREEDIRGRLLAQKLILQGQQERMQQVIALLHAGRMRSVLFRREDLLRKQSVSRGGLAPETVEKTGAGGKGAVTNKVDLQDVKVCTAYAEGKITVRISGGAPKDYTVILQPEQPAKGVGLLQPIVGTAVWSEIEKAAVAEIEVGALEEEYRIYID